jgi:hypothetical protein
MAKILVATVQNLVGRVTRRLGFVYSRCIYILEKRK